jgi:NAD(P)-dependent dehydrogenase (short-subunit alcohol dehydrogenase family)
VNTIRAILTRAIPTHRNVTIVTISSVVAHLYPAGLSDYVVSKAGLSALHHCLEAEARLDAKDDQVRFVLVEVGQMDTPLFSWIKPPNSLLAPVLYPQCVAEQIVRRLGQNSGSSILRLPMYASWVCGYDMLPQHCQRWARHLMGVDVAHIPKGKRENI